MKHFYFTIIFLLFTTLSALADGTKQLMPNCGSETNPTPQGTCYLALGSNQSKEFARYHGSSGTSKDQSRLYIKINDYQNEIVYLGFSDVLFTGTYKGVSYVNKELSLKDLSSYLGSNLKYRIVDPDGNTVKTGITTNSTGTSNNGEQTLTQANITDYKQAYYGPNSIRNDTKGYNPITFEPQMNGSYWIEFDLNSELTATTPQVDIKFFDITVANKQERKAIEGRIYGKTWGLTTTSFTEQAWSTFYTRSDDNYTSKVYLAGVQPYRFVFGCNSYGSIKTEDVIESRQSYPNANTFNPEYLVFLSKPDDKDWGGAAKVPNVPEQLTFAGDAITCEDLIFVIKLLHTEDAVIELSMTGSDGAKVIVDSLKANKIAERGYHYPWKIYTSLTEAKTYWYTPNSTEGCIRQYKLSLFDQRFRLNSTSSLWYNVGDTIYNNITETLEGDFKSNLSWSSDLGSETNPIIISSAEELKALRDAVNSGGNYNYKIKDLYFPQKNADGIDITFTINNNKNGGENGGGFAGVNFYLTAPTGSIKLDEDWEPIGTEDYPFQGTFRVGRYNPDPTKDNLNDTYSSNAGDQDTIIFTSGATKGLFGVCENAILDNIHVQGEISAMEEESFTEEAFGTICNKAINTSISHCTSYTTVKSRFRAAKSIGGLVGYAINCDIDSCYNYGPIEGLTTSKYGIGGIIGSAEESKLNFCFNIGTITSFGNAGGLIGTTLGNTEQRTEIVNSRNDGYINSTNASAGGFVGKVQSNIIFSDCLNNGNIFGDSAGSLVGKENTDINGLASFCQNNGNISSGYTRFGLKCTEIDHSISQVNGSTFYIKDAAASEEEPCAGFTTTASITDLGEEHFYENVNGITLYETECCGKMWRNEDAGRLFKNDSTFYVAWDGKYDNGECVTGDIDVDYQKTSGVTHFPFFDPELINSSNKNNNMKGLVVYRISPIQDSIKNLGKDGYIPSEYQSANNITNAKEAYGYQPLPKNFYNTTNLSDEEFGIELNLYWDDTKISTDGQCTKAKEGGYEYGKSIYTPKQEECNYVENTKYCKLTGIYGGDKCKKTAYVNGTLVCSSFKKCNDYYKEKKCTTTSAHYSCTGIENVSKGGYLGSAGGGHIFPIDNFGNNNTMNTWWNGVEVHGRSVLKLYENEPAILMPIVISKWIATNREKSVLLEWTTSSEENNDFFTVERSYDGIHWTKLGKLSGAGTTSVSHEYSFVDYEPLDGISYYRIRQTDFNGEYSYSSIKCINRITEKKNAFKAYTKKSSNEFIVEGKEIAACSIELYDTMGRKITNISYTTIDIDKVVISVEKLNAGTYIIKACNQAKTIAKNW